MLDLVAVVNRGYGKLVVSALNTAWVCGVVIVDVVICATVLARAKTVGGVVTKVASRGVVNLACTALSNADLGLCKAVVTVAVVLVNRYLQTLELVVYRVVSTHFNGHIVLIETDSAGVERQLSVII